MRDHYRAFKYAVTRQQGAHPKVMKTFALDLPDNWQDMRDVDSQGWVDIPTAKEANPSGGTLILLKLKDDTGTVFKLFDKQEFDSLVDKLGTKEIASQDFGAEHKGEFFSSVSSVEYDPEGKVKLTVEHLHCLNTRTRVELRAVGGVLEIRCPS